ncbi:hypothetical protein DO77_1719 [Brucella suis]|nr:hypothetical protein DO77_1719 [Brucella suis]
MIGNHFDKDESFLGEIVASGGLVPRETALHTLLGLQTLLGCKNKCPHAQP